MLGMFSMTEVQQKIGELKEKMFSHQETFHSAGTTVVVAPNQIISLELGDLSTAEHIKDTINTAFLNHADATLQIAHNFIKDQPKNIKMVLEQAMKQ